MSEGSICAPINVVTTWIGRNDPIRQSEKTQCGYNKEITLNQRHKLSLEDAADSEGKPNGNSRPTENRAGCEGYMDVPSSKRTYIRCLTRSWEKTKGSVIIARESGAGSSRNSHLGDTFEASNRHEVSNLQQLRKSINIASRLRGNSKIPILCVKKEKIGISNASVADFPPKQLDQNSCISSPKSSEVKRDIFYPNPWEVTVQKASQKKRNANSNGSCENSVLRSVRLNAVSRQIVTKSGRTFEDLLKESDARAKLMRDQRLKEKRRPYKELVLEEYKKKRVSSACGELGSVEIVSKLKDKQALLEKRSRKRDQIILQAREREEEELRKCTFKPILQIPKLYHRKVMKQESS